MRDFRKYPVYKEAKSLQVDVFALSRSWPRVDQYTLGHQIQRSVISIGSNIAEGAGRDSRKEFRRFLEIAIGSAFELEHQLETAHMLNLSSAEEVRPVLKKTQEIERQLGALRKMIGNAKPRQGQG